MDLASENAEACRADVERLLNALGATFPERLLLESLHDRLAAVVITLSAERRAPEIDLPSVDCAVSRGQKVLAGLTAVLTLLGAGANASGYSARDLFDSVTTSASAAQECFTEVQIGIALSVGMGDLGHLELRQLIDHARLLTLARLREAEAQHPNPTIVSNLDRVLLGLGSDEVRPSYIRAQLAETLDRIKELEDRLGLGDQLGARAAIDGALHRPGPTDHLTALLEALGHLADVLG
jgi:hypothetical protein